MRTTRELEAAIQSYEQAAAANTHASTAYLAAFAEMTRQRAAGYRQTCKLLAGETVIGTADGERTFWRADANLAGAAEAVRKTAVAVDEAERGVRELLGALAALREFPRRLRKGVCGDYYAEGIEYAVVWRADLLGGGWHAKARWLPEAPLLGPYTTPEEAANAIDAVLVTK